MNWTRIVIAGVVAGIVVNLANFVMHGLILGNTYTKYPEVFDQNPANPIHFFVVAISAAILAAVLFAKTRGSWAPGWKGGATFGFLLGLAFFFPQFYMPIVIDGFPYFLAWCWGGVNVIGGVILGAVLGAIYK